MMDSMQAEAVKVEDAVETLSTLSDLSARADVTRFGRSCRRLPTRSAGRAGLSTMTRWKR